MTGAATVIVEQIGREVKISILPDAEWESILDTVWNSQGFLDWIKNNLSLPTGVKLDDNRNEPISIDRSTPERPEIVLAPSALWWTIDRREESAWSIVCDSLMHAHETFERVTKTLFEIMTQVVTAIQNTIDKNPNKKTQRTFTITMRN